jgi:hypothetical protein
MTRPRHFLALLALACCAQGADLVVDACRSAANWRFSPGGEFPGAKGTVSQAADGVALAYDFSGGGSYVAAVFRGMFPPELDVVQLRLRAVQGARVQLRVEDATGRTFQAVPVNVPVGTKSLSYPMAGPWRDAWGGTKSPTPAMPLRAVWVMACKSDELPNQGELIVQELGATTKNDPPAEALLPLPPTEATLAGWRLKVASVEQWNNPTLSLTATRVDGQAGWLSVEFPVNGRKSVSRYRLDPTDSPCELSYPVPVTAGGNPRNRYPLRFSFVGDGGQEGSLRVTMNGREAGAVNFGDAKTSLELPDSRFGVCTHFSFGLSGAFKGWSQVDRLLDEASACGFKWIREGCRMETDDDGVHVRPYDLEWMRKAKAKDMDVILVISMSADETMEAFLAKVEAVVRDTKDLGVVYELGNEPNNFGNWRQKFGGPWNGREKDNSTSPWVVEHLKYTNAGAEKIKELLPEATVIGLGAVPPTNFRYLELGLSKAVDGVVEHPYTYSLPPERMPYSLALTERDGRAVGDAEGSFVGLINSYHAKFKETGQARSLWVTEFGFTTYWFNGENEKGLYAGFTEEAQAAYLVRRFLQGLALPIEVSCQYDLLDDYGSTPKEAEANFGILRGDYSRKPCFYALQRMNALFAGAELDPALTIETVAQPLHRSARQKELVKNWDGAEIDGSNDVVSYGFTPVGQNDRRLLAVWNEQAYSRQFNNRIVTLELKGWQDFVAQPVAINLLTGESFDVKVEKTDTAVRLVDLSVEQAPLAIWFFKGE